MQEKSFSRLLTTTVCVKIVLSCVAFSFSCGYERKFVREECLLAFVASDERNSEFLLRYTVITQIILYVKIYILLFNNCYFQIGVKRTEQTDHGPSDGLLSADGSVHCTLNAFQTAQ